MNTQSYVAYFYEFTDEYGLTDEVSRQTAKKQVSCGDDKQERQQLFKAEGGAGELQDCFDQPEGASGGPGQRVEEFE